MAVDAPSMKTVFGPVPSRRLGRSLGIDLIPPKTCSYDCVYCESGRTTRLTVKREPFVVPEQVIRDLEDYFQEYPQGADVLTLSSAGEPTLYEPLGELLRGIKSRFPSLPLVVLTNGSLLWNPQVRQDLLVADRVVPSLDAVSLDVFQRINRPHPMLNLDHVIEGLYAFRREYRGRLHVEVLLVPGLNDAPDHLNELRRVLDRINPEQIELNTVVRPPADPRWIGFGAKEISRMLEYFPSSKTVVIGEFQGGGGVAADADLERRIKEMILRRPCTVEEMSASLGVPVEQLGEAVGRLTREDRIIHYLFNEKRYLRVGDPLGAGEAASPCDT